ncbi:SIR2 family protein [Bibersteinia trehalosi]|uniref:SIR2 family protein n=1 Tax=Bibersteinia trehalosi TaxID=47735 RepID=A0A426FH62_BIBTR|nr:SIR2 family protein [Bibersteinia trehalosi]RRN03735.1 SIR2 family protein [Bibersteinia trehalosi]
MNIKFLSSDITEKEPITIDLKKQEDDQQKEYKALLQKCLNQILDAENIIILAGSGTSLTFNLPESEHIAPSMTDLWHACRGMNEKIFDNIRQYTHYDNFAGKWDDGRTAEDIELFLSRCDTFLTLEEVSATRLKQLRKFIKDAKNKILEVTDFTEKITDPQSWNDHEKLLRVLGKRQAKQKRLKVFTTNYDLAFETAASNIGMTVIDGFEYSIPYRFNPSWFNYDIVHRTQSSDKSISYLPNVFHLYKIHGSVDWIRTEQGIQKRRNEKQQGEPVIIYPSSNKYQTSYESPYLDMVSSFLNAIQQPKTAILCLGFGFNDKHINNAITMALRTNPELLLMVGTRSLFDEKGSFNKEIRSLLINAVKAGDSRISLVDSDFSNFVNQLPDRNKSTPEEDIFKIFQELAMGNKS